MVTKSCCDGRYPGNETGVATVIDCLIRQTEGDPTSREGE